MLAVTFQSRQQKDVTPPKCHLLSSCPRSRTFQLQTPNCWGCFSADSGLCWLAGCYLFLYNAAVNYSNSTTISSDWV